MQSNNQLFVLSATFYVLFTTNLIVKFCFQLSVLSDVSNLIKRINFNN